MTHDLKERLYAYFANKPNKTSEEERLASELENELPYYEIASISCADLEDYGFDTSKVTDGVMQRIATKMGDAYVGDGFWIDLEIIAEFEGVPKNK